MRFHGITPGVPALLAALLFTLPASAQVPVGESPYIFGLHDPDGESNMSGTHKGWILFTEAVGHNPADVPNPTNYATYSNAGYGVIVRINNGYAGRDANGNVIPKDGTLPYEADYDAFAQTVATFVAKSSGAHIWIIGNETNTTNEYPAYKNNTPEPITVARYVSCFSKVRAKIRALAGHTSDQVVIQATVTYNANQGDWVAYHQQIITSLGQGNLDGIAIHTYTHGGDPALITSDAPMGTYPNRHFDFRAYRDYMGSHPAWAQSLPVYITETDQTDTGDLNNPVGWVNSNSGWVKNAYAEINTWNQNTANQKIRSLVLYRWSEADPPFGISSKPNVIQDFKEAVSNDYRWTIGNIANVSLAATTPAFFMPGQLASVNVATQNLGSTTWTGGGSTSPYRLGTTSSNSMMFNTFPQCSGYANAVNDARVYTCSNVAPGANYTYSLELRAPTTATTAQIGMQMVQDGVQWFGATASKTIHVGTPYCGTAVTQCILDARTDILPFYQQNGWNTSCSNRDNIVNNWCSGLDPNSCNALKTGACSAFNNSTRCSGGSHFDRTAIDPNGTFAGYRNCGGDFRIYECRSTGWFYTGIVCK